MNFLEFIVTVCANPILAIATIVLIFVGVIKLFEFLDKNKLI